MYKAFLGDFLSISTKNMAGLQLELTSEEDF